MSAVSPALNPPALRHGAHRAARSGLLGATQRTLLTLAVAATMFSGLLVSPAEAAGRTYVGAAGAIDTLSRQAGAPMARHNYSHFHKRVPSGADMISVRADATWRQVAAARPGSTLHNHIVRWAKEIKARRAPVQIAYHHEPEARHSDHYGTPGEFIAAYRKVVSIFNAQGATNVTWVWQMTAHSFITKPSDGRHAAKWYPGNAYVDDVGADGYNWGNCYGHNKWRSMASFMDPVIRFARAHGKTASLPEFGAAPDKRRAQWLRDSTRYLIANRDVISAVYYFNNGGTSRCSWQLTTAAEWDAYGDLARNTTYFRS